jgi:hypothetical protein
MKSIVGQVRELIETSEPGMRVIGTNLLSVVGMLRDYIVTLDQAIGISLVPVRDLPALRH